MAATPGDEEAKKQANEKVGKELGVPIFFGSLFLGFGLGYMRVLPGTRRPKARTQEQRAGDALATWSPNCGVYHAGVDAGAHAHFNVTPAPFAPPQKASPPRPQPPSAVEAQAAPYRHPQKAASPESAIGSIHTFHLAGFISRFGRFVLAFVVMGGIGAVMCGAPDAARNGIVFVALGLVAMGVIGTIVVVARAFGVLRVQLSPEGVAWSGLFGSDFRGWDTITDVYRREHVLIQGRKRHYTRWVQLVFSDRRTVKFDQCLTGFDVLAGTIQLVSADRIASEKRAELAEAGQATFGTVSLRSDGILVDGTLIPWQSVRRNAIINGCLDLDTDLPGWFFRVHKNKPLSAVPNYPALFALMADLGRAPVRPMEQGFRF
jgi:hypothetical protein